MRNSGLERRRVVALWNADSSGCRAESTTAELIAASLGLLAEEVEANLAAARRRFRPVGAGALHTGAADIIGTGVDADVVALDRPLTSADLAFRRGATGGGIGIADADRSSAAITATTAGAASAAAPASAGSAAGPLLLFPPLPGGDFVVAQEGETAHPESDRGEPAERIATSAPLGEGTGDCIEPLEIHF